MRMISIDRTAPHTQTQGEHPNCEINGCSSPADFTIAFGDDNGYGCVQRCRAHFEIHDPHVPAKNWIGYINNFLPKDE
jgi:hypothetical protein